MEPREPYPSDVSDEEWAFLAPYLTLMREDAPQRDHALREVFNALRYLVRGGIAWRMMPNDLPPWHTVHQQTQRWIKAGLFEDIVHDLRCLLRLAAGRNEDPSAAIFDSRTLQSTTESGHRAGYDGANANAAQGPPGRPGTLGHLLALHVTKASEQDRAQVELLAEAVEKATHQRVELAYVDQGYTGQESAEAAARHGIALYVVRLPEAKRGFVLLPRRWVAKAQFCLDDEGEAFGS